MTPAGLAVGAVAPDFALRDQHAREHRLAEHRGTHNVVLVFYPFAFTGVCTGELAAIRDELDSLHNDTARVFAVSCDPVSSLRAFAEQERLEFPLLSDFWPHGAVAEAYGVFNEGLGTADRGTFIIDRAGVIRWTVRTSITRPRDVADYQKALTDL